MDSRNLHVILLLYRCYIIRKISKTIIVLAFLCVCTSVFFCIVPRCNYYSLQNIIYSGAFIHNITHSSYLYYILNDDVSEITHFSAGRCWYASWFHFCFYILFRIVCVFKLTILLLCTRFEIRKKNVIFSFITIFYLKSLLLLLFFTYIHKYYKPM